MVRIDVHILIMPTTRQDWLHECLDSMKDEPVIIHLCPGIDGDIAKARTDAFKFGTSKFISFVDPDDEIVPGIFSKLVKLLDDNPSALMAYSDEVLMDGNKNIIGFGWSRNPHPFIDKGYNIKCHKVDGNYIHHLRVMRRSAVNSCLPLKIKRMPEPVLMHELSRIGKFIHLKEIGYKWRIHGNNTFSTYTPDEHNEVDQWLGSLATGT